MELKFEKWVEEYIPIKNIFSDNESDTSYRSYLYHFKGQEYFKVKSFPANNVWVLISENSHLGIQPFTGIVKNRWVILGFFITMNSWNNDKITIWENIN